MEASMSFPRASLEPGKSIRMTAVKLRAQRANARLSKGPKTPEGRRRAALNRRGMKLSFLLQGEKGRLRERKELLRIWRDLLALFWFVKPGLREEEPKLESCLEKVAWDWWEKLQWLRDGFSKEGLWRQDGRIEGDLWSFLFEFRLANRKADYWLCKEFGTNGRTFLAPLRESIEKRLGAFRKYRNKLSRGKVSLPAGDKVVLPALAADDLLAVEEQPSGPGELPVVDGETIESKGPPRG
jgi:hypothetical protein